MTADVQVRFGASIGELIEGVSHVRESIDSVGESVAGLNEKFHSLAEIAGVALSIEGFKSFIEGMAHLGTDTERSMATLGISAEQVGELSGVAKLTGTSFEALSTTFERMTLNVQKSTRDAFNPAAQVLQVLGLNAKDLIGLPMDQYFERLQTAISKFNPSMNVTNAVMAIGGRGIASMLPLLLESTEHFKELKAEVAKTGATLNDAQAHAFAQTHEKLELMALSAQGLGIKLFQILKPAVDAAADAISHWLQSIRSDDIRDVVNDIGTFLIDLAANIAQFFVTAQEKWRTFVSTINTGMPALHAAAASSAIVFGQFGVAIDQAKQALAGVGNAESFEKIGKDADAAREKIEAMRQAALGSLASAAPRSGSFGAQAADIIALGDELDELVKKYNRANAAALPASGKDEARADIEFWQSRIKAENDAFATTKEHLGAEVRTFQITEAEKTSALVAAINVREDQTVFYLQQELASGRLSAQDRQKIEDQITAAHDKAVKDRAQATDQSLITEMAAWNA